MTDNASTLPTALRPTMTVEEATEAVRDMRTALAREDKAGRGLPRQNWPQDDPIAETATKQQQVLTDAVDRDMREWMAADLSGPLDAVPHVCGTCAKWGQGARSEVAEAPCSVLSGLNLATVWTPADWPGPGACGRWAAKENRDA